MAIPPPAENSTALVTGASSGIGAELARQLADRGHSVVLVARREDRLRELADEIHAQHGVRAEAIGCDLTEPAARDELLAKVDQLGLTTEVLVNCAGFSTVGDLEALDPERERAELRTNAEAVQHLCCAVLPGMVERGRGAILNVASMGGFQPIPRWATYSGSKAFAIFFSEALAAEAKPKGVTVTVLCPGPVKTEFTQVSGIEAAEESTPGFLWAEPDEIARAGIRGLERGKRQVIPRTLPKIVSWVGRHAPRRLSLAVLRKVWLSGEEAAS